MQDEWRRLIDQFASKCDWVSIREYRENVDYFRARNGKRDGAFSDIDHGVMVEVMLEGHLAYAGTCDLTTTGIEKAFDRAYFLAKNTNAFKLNSFDTQVRPPHVGEYTSQREQSIQKLKASNLQSHLNEITKALKVTSDVFETSAWAKLVKTQINYASSNGSSWSQDFELISKDFSAIAKKDSQVQNRSYGMNAKQIGLEDFDLKHLIPAAQKIGHEAVELLSARDCPSDTRDLILAPSQLYLQVHESIGHPLEVDRILGDERNYAGWSFVSPDDFGKLQYGSDILNVTFDPFLKGEMASYNFDDNGVKANKEYLIKDGLLLRGLGGVESQNRSKIPGVSCARSCSWNRPPMDRMANINIEPGTSSLDDMIKGTEKGIIMHTNKSWSIDDYRNKFQFGCEYAQLIENGKITETVKNPNYRGVTDSFWKNLKMVGDRSTFETWGSPYCGKGEPNQIIRVGHAIPTCLFKDIEVFGGA